MAGGSHPAWLTFALAIGLTGMAQAQPAPDPLRDLSAVEQIPTVPLPDELWIDPTISGAAPLPPPAACPPGAPPAQTAEPDRCPGVELERPPRSREDKPPIYLLREDGVYIRLDPESSKLRDDDDLHDLNPLTSIDRKDRP